MLYKSIFGVFTIAFVVCLASVSFFNDFYARQSLQRDAEQLLYQFHDALLEARRLLNGFPVSENAPCDEQASKQLAELAYTSPAVRTLGFINSDGKGCVSAPHFPELTTYRESIERQAQHRLAENLYLSNAIEAGAGLDLLMIRFEEGRRYFASINPFMVDYLSELACLDCLEYDFIIEGKPRLKFESRAMSNAPVVEFSTTRADGAITVNLQLRGTDTFYEYYRELSWATTILFSILVASILSYLCYKLLSIRQSPERIIRDAVRYNEFVPFYQPIVNSVTGEIMGAEVLARWQRSDGAIVPPYQFIPFAEDSGLIVDITEQLVRKMVRDLVALDWRESDKFMSINIVPEQLKTTRLFRFISSEVKAHGLQSSAVSLEITERMEIDNLQQARETLELFYKEGITLKLDDAGTGYGGFSYVQELDVSTLKIDKMFVDTINKNDVKRSVLDAIIAFAKASNIELIAEGVEQEYQVDYLKEQGVTQIQGYFYAKPMPINEFLDWLGRR